MNCQQSGCTNEATHIVYWPNQETKQCKTCSDKVKNLATFMGFTVAVVPIKDND